MSTLPELIYHQKTRVRYTTVRISHQSTYFYSTYLCTFCIDSTYTLNFSLKFPIFVITGMSGGMEERALLLGFISYSKTKEERVFWWYISSGRVDIMHA
jgi:hypothetical protein